MSKKISIILLTIFMLGMIFAGFVMLKNNKQPSSNKNIQEAGFAVPAGSATSDVVGGGGGQGGPPQQGESR